MFALFLAVLLAVAPLRSETIKDLFTRIREAQAGVETLEAHFEQVKRSSLLVGEAVSQGRMLYQKPDLIRWEYLSPDPHTILIEGDRFRAYYPELRKLKTARVARLRHRLFNFFVATEPLERLKAHFQVEWREGGERPIHTLVLTPLTRQIQKALARVTVQVDKTSFLPREILIEETDGDSARIRFVAVEVNRDLPADAFLLQVPPGTAEEPYAPGGR